MYSHVKNLLKASFRALGYDIVPLPRHAQWQPESASRPICEIPFPEIDSAKGHSFIDEILAAPVFKKTTAYFAEAASNHSLLSPDAQALLYTMARNLEPLHVIEIGTFRGGTSEGICRALQANGIGILHTVDPFGADVVPNVIAGWPSELQKYVHYYSRDSMAFFASMPRHIRSPLIFIDGNHDYEYAAFDVRAAARVVARGGYLVIDNISQLGPYRAGCELLEGEPGWVECGHSSRRYDPARPFDAHRTTIHNTDLMVLRAPDHLIVSSRPVTTGQIPIKDRNIKAIELSPVGEVSGGTLSMQIISRSFGERQIEHTTEMQTDLQGAGLVQLDIHPPFHPPSDATAVTAEIWLSWAGSTDLRLSCTPRVLSI